MRSAGAVPPLNPSSAPVSGPSGADTLRGGVPEHGLRLEQLEREICELAAHIAAATCRWLLLVAEFDERGGWAEWGVKSCAHWLSWRCSIAPRSAREHVRVGRALRLSPRVLEAFAAGELSYSKVRALTRVATPETESQLLELARHATGGQLDKLVRLYGGVLAATTSRSEETYRNRNLTYYWEDDGSLHLDARLPADDGALVLEALKVADGQLPGQDEPAPGPATRRADALVALARGTLAQTVQDRPGGDRCELVVHVDVETLGDDRVHERSELSADRSWLRRPSADWGATPRP